MSEELTRLAAAAVAYAEARDTFTKLRANMAPDYIRDVTTANRNANRALQDAARAYEQAREAEGGVMVDRVWLAKTARLLHTMTGEGLLLEGEDDPWDLFMATGPVLGFDRYYSTDTALRAMISALIPASPPQEQEP